MSLGKVANFAQVVVTLASFLMCAAVFFVSSPPSISDEYRCVIEQKCTQEIEARIFYSFAILFAGLTYPWLMSINSALKRLGNISNEIKENHDMLKAMASGSIVAIDSNRFEDFYEQALTEIRLSNRAADIIATSSFTPPDDDMRDKYFSKLADIIISHATRYRVLMAKGNPSEWDDYCIKELEIRIAHLNRAGQKASPGRTAWDYGNQFTARRSRYHARIDFLVVSDNVFMNVALSEAFDGPRGYIYIKDEKVAQVFRGWFEVIWQNPEMSDKVEYKKDTPRGTPKITLL